MPQTASCAGFRACVLIPTYNNPLTIENVVREARNYLPDVIVVDDGSSQAGRAACAQIARQGLAHVHHRPYNGGKGAAVKTGFALAREQGFSHALQVDGDAQHDLKQVPQFLAAARAHSTALVIAYPVYDHSVPAIRRLARRFTDFWVNLEAGRGVIRDAMIGFRVYPLAAVEGLRVAGDRMDFDIEVAVRLAWKQVPVINLPVAVRYLAAADGGVSHFRPLLDNLRFSWLHSKLCTAKCVNAVLRFFSWRRGH